jgi:MFS transporter, DHA1 family, multidrug resistance protein
MPVPEGERMQLDSPPSLLRDPAYVVALVVAVVVALGFGLVVPVLPLFARAFGVGLFAVTLLVSVFAGIRLVSNLYTGALTDRFGSRSAIGWGALIVAFSSLLCATAQSYWALLAYRGFGGFGSALFFNALLTHVVGLVGPERRGRAVGGLQGAFLAGISLGPTVGGLLAEPLGLRWPFAIYAVFCGSAGLVALAFLPRGVGGEDEEEVDAARGPDDEPVAAAQAGAEEPARPREERDEPRPRGLLQLLRATRDLCKDPTFVAALVLMAASRWAATGVRFSLVPVFAVEEIGATELVMSLGLTVAALAHLAVVYPAGKIADTAGRKALTVPAYLAFGVIAIGLAFVGSIPAYLVVLTLYGLATGFTSVTPPAIVGDIVPKRRTGVSIGVLNTAGDAGSVLGPLVSGILAQQVGYAAGFGASGVLLVVAGLVALRMRETLPSKATVGQA